MRKILIALIPLLVLCIPIFFATPYAQGLFGNIHNPIESSVISTDLLSGKAKVYVDGKFLQNAPFKFVSVSPGSHTITMIRDGHYATFSRSMEFLPGTDTYIYWNLGPTADSSSGFITYFIKDYAHNTALYFKTRDAQITLNGKNVGTGDLLVDTVRPMMYSVHISKRGYEPITLQVHPQVGYILVVESQLFKIPFKAS